MGVQPRDPSFEFATSILADVDLCNDHYGVAAGVEDMVNGD